MPGYGQRVILHVDAETRTERGGTARRLKIKAQFLLDGHTDQSLTFIDDEVRIPHFDDCQYANEEHQVGNIAVGTIVTIIILCIIGLIGRSLTRFNGFLREINCKLKTLSLLNSIFFLQIRSDFNFFICS